MTVLAPDAAPIMASAEKATPSAYPAHANVLALVSAYQDKTHEPMPWNVLVDAVARLQQANSDAALPVYGSARAIDTLSDIVTDLRRLALVNLGPRGTTLTPAAKSVVQTWNGEFKRRSERASDALTRVGILA